MHRRGHHGRRDPQIRHELVERVRHEIALGVYETPEKWEIALGRLLRRLEGEEGDGWGEGGATTR